MELNRKYEILDSLPAYGPMAIPVTGYIFDYYSEGFVIRLYKDDGTSWIGNFQPGATLLNKIFPLHNNLLLIIAGGECYIMNPDQTKPIFSFGDSYTQVFITEDGKIILPGDVDITVVEPNGAYWYSERISWDGFKDIRFDKNIISGYAYYPMTESETNQWIYFSYDIETKTRIGGSYPQP